MTIGFGDTYISTHIERILVFIFTLFNTIFIFLLINIKLIFFL